MKILKEYIYGKQFQESSGRLGHHYITDYEITDLYCPDCGVQDVWEEQGEGDYYVGSHYVCAACGTEHYLDNSGSEADPKLVNQLKTGVTDTPTTPKGN